jgi:hypothetical protein
MSVYFVSLFYLIALLKTSFKIYSTFLLYESTHMHSHTQYIDPKDKVNSLHTMNKLMLSSSVLLYNHDFK